MWSAISLPVLLAIRSMRHHRIVAVATVLGVAIGMTVVCAILIVDNNTRDVPPDQPQAFVETEATLAARRAQRLVSPTIRIAPPVENITISRADSRKRDNSLVPSQRGGADRGKSKTLAARGSEDYAAMRLAVRLASLLSFLVGAVIVFYTMRFSVTARARILPAAVSWRKPARRGRLFADRGGHSRRCWYSDRADRGDPRRPGPASNGHFDHGTDAGRDCFRPLGRTGGHVAGQHRGCHTGRRLAGPRHL